MGAQTRNLQRIVVAGGGAGGLELATRLGDTLGRRGLAEVTLIDRARTHLWKPLLHQAGAGSLDIDDQELEYLAQARWHHFRFRLGAMDGLDRARKEVFVAPTLDEEGNEVIPRRRFPYDTLVICVGSQGNDFGIPGVREHAICLDTAEDAARFHRRLINACLKANTQPAPVAPGQLSVAIIGAGATGVELAAELHKSMREVASYGLDRIDPDKHVKLVLIEAGPRILPALPERLSDATLELLKALDVQVLLRRRVVGIDAQGVTLDGGEFIPAALKVWAAGIQAPEFLARLDGLAVNRVNQMMVRETLETTRDENIFALGDCAACPWMGRAESVPPRAQAAHQQASLLAKSLKRRLRGQPLLRFVYRDFGSLVSLGEYSTVGSLMGGLVGGSVWVQGHFARLMYWSLYRMHLIALHGYVKVVLHTLAGLITRRTEPHVKLH